MSDYPPKITRTAAESGLGEIVGRYRQSVLWELVYAVCFTVFGLICVLAGDEVGRWMGAVTLVLASPCYLTAWVKARRHLYLCSDGLLTTTAKTTVRIIRAWVDVVHLRVWTVRIYQQGGPQDIPRCVLVLEDGTKVNLARPPYAKSEELIMALEQRLAPTIHARRTAEIDEKGATEFGPITITVEGVRDGDRFVRWTDISQMERGRARLRIWSGWGRPVISRQLRRIPDVRVLMTLVAENVERHSEPLREA
ncbi:hypothetical protein Ssi03_63220 [Sphaerisporangium siamense]|uniref:Uncharacterized protein n=1 Tax=Sphaerisporangium siamense TaxID=795645 RepID=A0A7W7D6Y1_9ACTN|nr:DUF6585 family protein [Sphaerisporangium siamense]MBB4700505.1 hypothetical protein [Sphaerisporangium siamense]GII88332.1 hypothetical protein Ssi03_63220 [Sphaerisporangium siamense]